MTALQSGAKPRTSHPRSARVSSRSLAESSAVDASPTSPQDRQNAEHRSLAPIPLAVGVLLVAIAPLLYWLLGHGESESLPGGAPFAFELLYHYFGRTGLAAFSLVSGLVWILAALTLAAPKIGSLSIILVLLGVLTALGRYLSLHQKYVLAGGVYFVISLLVAVSLPGKAVRLWATRMAWFGGAIAGGVLAALYGRWGGVALATLPLALAAFLRPKARS